MVMETGAVDSNSKTCFCCRLACRCPCFRLSSSEREIEGVEVVRRDMEGMKAVKKRDVHDDKSPHQKSRKTSSQFSRDTHPYRYVLTCEAQPLVRCINKRFTRADCGRRLVDISGGISRRKQCLHRSRSDKTESTNTTMPLTARFGLKTERCDCAEHWHGHAQARSLVFLTPSIIFQSLLPTNR